MKEQGLPLLRLVYLLNKILKILKLKLKSRWADNPALVSNEGAGIASAETLSESTDRLCQNAWGELGVKH